MPGALGDSSRVSLKPKEVLAEMCMSDPTLEFEQADLKAIAERLNSASDHTLSGAEVREVLKLLSEREPQHRIGEVVEATGFTEGEVLAALQTIRDRKAQEALSRLPLVLADDLSLNQETPPLDFRGLAIKAFMIALCVGTLIVWWSAPSCDF